MKCRVIKHEAFPSEAVEIIFYGRADDQEHIYFLKSYPVRAHKMKAKDPGDSIPIPNDAAQDLMDGLWNLGFRPKEKENNA